MAPFSRIRALVAFVIAALGFGMPAIGFSETSCAQRITVRPDQKITIRLADFSVGRPALVLGFNLESVPFQRAFWREDDDAVAPDVTDALKLFPGSVLRYPGGTVSNLVDLSAAIGSTRRIQSLVNWANPARVAFGPNEYANFVKSVGGNAWVVANVFGDVGGPLDPNILAARSRVAIRAVAAVTTPLRIELGNELYLPYRGISGGQYLAMAIPTLNMLRAEFPAIKPVVGLAGLDGGKLGASFNREVLDGLPIDVSDFSLHYYYDGPPGGLPIRSLLSNLCTRINEISEVRGRRPSIWITEHGRWPGGKVGQPHWASLWPNTYSLGAALATAEFLIAVAQIPEISGAFLHALAAPASPWALFHKRVGGAGFDTSATFRAQALFRSLPDSEVLSTQVSAPERKGIPSVRGVLYRDRSGSLGLLATHRSDSVEQASIHLPEFAGARVGYSLDVLSGHSLDTTTESNEKKGIREDRTFGTADFGPDGKFVLFLPPNSVIRLTFSAGV